MAIQITGQFTPSSGAGAFNLINAADIETTVVSKTGTYTATTTDTVMLCNGTFTINLYTAVNNSGNILFIKNIGTGVVTVDGNGSQTIDGDLTKDIQFQNSTMMIICDGANWNII